MHKFEVGTEYYPTLDGSDPIKILRRTEKTIWVSDGRNNWYMRVRTGGHGKEYAVDSSGKTKKYKEAFTYLA